jgi:tetratricopeptide (TPR) repeat protein
LAALASLLGCLGGIAHADASRAREHYQRGTTLFDLTKYREAAAEYEAAYQEKPDAALLFNIAQAYRLAGDNEKAIRFYKTYLHRIPTSENRSEVQSRIDELQGAIDQQKKAQQGPPEGTLRPEESKPAPAMPTPPSPQQTTSQPTAELAATAPPPEHKPVYKKWWLWTIVAVVVVGVGVGIAVGITETSGSTFNANVGTFGPGALTVRY